MDAFTDTQWPLYVNVIVFAVGALVVGIAGTRLTFVADVLADRTRIGEAIAGAVLLGATTSLAGSMLSVSAAWHDRPDLAMSNAIGGIAVQTAFLAVADIAYRRANLEHAAASAVNMMQGALLVCLLAIVLMGAFAPETTFWGVHPTTPILLATYAYGISHVHRASVKPMWRPAQTGETKEDVPEPESDGYKLTRLWGEFLVLAAILGASGWVLEYVASQIAAQTGMSQTAVGMVLTSVSTSLPELVTSVAAVRRGALTLAVGGIIGGNAFDTLFAAFSDIAYRTGSIYHAASEQLLFLVALTILMTGVLLMGLLRRERKGIAGIGFESFAILVLYAFAVVFMLNP